MARKKLGGAMPQMGALVQPPTDPGTGAMPGMPAPAMPQEDPDLQYHADQLLHHAAKQTKGYKTARRKLIAGAKRTMRSQNFQF